MEAPRSISVAGRWSKALLAAALALGTLGTTLALVDVAPAAAAGTPTITSISPTSGSLAGGSANKITITGTNFETKADDTVDFGPGNPGTVDTEASGTSMVVYPPAATQFGSVQLTVTTTVSGGTSNAVTYTYAAAPTVTALYSANGSTSGGTTIIITGNNFVGPGAVTAVKFNTTAATSYTVNSNTNISAVVPNMPDTDMAGKTYYVTVTTDSGTSAEGPGSAWYWFGAGTCTMSGPGVQNSGAPPRGERLHLGRQRGGGWVDGDDGLGQHDLQ
ncbi:MAG: IPT/TIG domain-containing protein [Acidimicrobiales bacterium]